VVAPARAVSKALSWEAVRRASDIASLNAWMASKVVRVIPGSSACNFSFNSFVPVSISPKGRTPEYRVGRCLDRTMPHLPAMRAARFSATAFPIALITPIPVTKTLLTEVSLLGSVLFDICDHGINVNQYFTAFFRIFYDDPIFPVEKDDQFERIDGVQAKTFVK
jgi:hypothetical protein